MPSITNNRSRDEWHEGPANTDPARETPTVSRGAPRPTEVLTPNPTQRVQVHNI